MRIGTSPAEPGEHVDTVTLQTQVPPGHKVALRDLPAGAPIRKYGEVIGIATAVIPAGSHVHVHNVRHPDEVSEGQAPASVRAVEASPAGATFPGYVRADGSVGVRNHLAVVATVNCSATVVKAICRQAAALLATRPDLDGIVPITHAQGCAQAIGGEGYDVLNRCLAGWTWHPNVVAALVIGLGCEGTRPDSIEARRAGRRPGLPLRTFDIQGVGGTAAAIAHGVDLVRQLLEEVPVQTRGPAPVSALRLALNCGGSDGLSGLTANPLLGAASDRLVAMGAGVALAEVPECHGCEHLLAARAPDPATRAALADVFAWWRDHAGQHGVVFNDNLAPGNIAGGLTTIVEKSLGAMAKAGTTPLRDVVGYGLPLTRPGFSLMNTPGFDPASVTGLVAGGAQLVAFTTGRGSVYGASIAPTLKIATNSRLARAMPGDVDFDAGRALEGDVDALADELVARLLAVAGGEVRTASEQLGLGWEEFVPWSVGATL